MPLASGAGPTCSGLEAGGLRWQTPVCSFRSSGLMLISLPETKVERDKEALAGTPTLASSGALLLVLEWTFEIQEMMLKSVAVLRVNVSHAETTPLLGS